MTPPDDLLESGRGRRQRVLVGVMVVATVGVMVAVGAHVGGFIAGVILQKPLLLWRYRRA